MLTIYSIYNKVAHSALLDISEVVVLDIKCLYCLNVNNMKLCIDVRLLS